MNKGVKWITITISSIMALLVFGVLALYWMAQRYISSDEFRDLLGKKTSEYLTVEVEYAPLQWSGLSVYASQLHQKAPSTGSIAKLQAEQIRAQINFRPLLSGELRIETIDVQNVSIEFQNPRPEEEKIQPTQAPSTPEPLGMLASVAPHKVTIGTVTVENGSFRWPSGDSSYGEATQMQLVGETSGNDWNIRATQGKIQFPNLPKMQVKSFKGRMKSDSLFITNADLQVGTNGLVQVSGEVGFGEGTDSLLKIDLRSVPASSVLTGDWKMAIQGDIDGNLTFEQSQKSSGEQSLTGKVELKHGTIEALPILNTIAELTRTQEFRSIKLETAKGMLHWTPKKLSLDTIDIESKGLLKITGNVIREPQKLEGLLQVGTTASALQYIPGARQKVFTEQLDTYLSTPVQLSGTPDAWEEDLTPRLKTAAIGAAIEGVQSTVKDGVKGLIDFGRTLLNGDKSSTLPTLP